MSISTLYTQLIKLKQTTNISFKFNYFKFVGVVGVVGVGVGVGIITYKLFHSKQAMKIINGFICKFKNKNNKNNKVAAVPDEFVKYDNSFYAELDELKKQPECTTETEPCASIREVTPRGEILMYYDKPTSAFFYYSNHNNLPYRTLDAVARKYVCEYRLPSIYVDIRDEIKKGYEKSCSNISNTNVDTKTQSSIFAEFKNYKKGTKGNGNGNGNGTSFVFKENINKFIFKGRIDDFLQQKEKETEKEKEKEKAISTSTTTLTYSDYKKSNNL